MYNDLADPWRDKNGPLHLLKVMVNPWCVSYFLNALTRHFGSDLSHICLFDIGCGGGVLTEEFAQLECQVTGIDNADDSLAATGGPEDESNGQGCVPKYRCVQQLHGNITDLLPPMRYPSS